MSWGCAWCQDTGKVWIPNPMDPTDVDREICDCEAGEELTRRAPRLAEPGS